MKLLPALMACLAFSAQAADDMTLPAAKVRLQKILSCQVSAQPKEVLTIIKRLGGLGIVQKSPESDAEYTIPNPVEIFGRPVTKISIHQGANDDGDFNEYGAIFSGETFGAVARIAGIKPDAVGNYRQEIGNNDLILRPEAGVMYVTCANDVRTFMKAVRRANKVANQTSVLQKAY